MRRLEEAGVLTRYVALVDSAKVGWGSPAFAQVALERQETAHLDYFVRSVAGWPEVLKCYLLTGDMDYQFKIVARRLRGDFKAFLRDKLTRAAGVAEPLRLAFRPIVAAPPATSLRARWFI